MMWLRRENQEHYKHHDAPGQEKLDWRKNSKSSTPSSEDKTKKPWKWPCNGLAIDRMVIVKGSQSHPGWIASQRGQEQRQSGIVHLGSFCAWLPL
jgi:hypothetical protein